MPWARVDENANSDAKLLALSDPAHRMWNGGNVYCQKNQTEGFIPEWAIHSFGVRHPNKKKLIDELCTALVPGKRPLWHRVEGGYQMNDYLDWNDPRTLVEAKRERAKERLRKFRARLRNSAQSSVSQRVSGNAETPMKRVVKRVSQHDPERVLFAVPRTQEQIQERTAPAAPRDCGKPVEKRQPASPWKRAVAIAHLVMEQVVDRRDWTEDFKVRCGQQGIDYGALNDDGRPLYARALEYVEGVRARRRAS